MWPLLLMAVILWYQLIIRSLLLANFKFEFEQIKKASLYRGFEEELRSFKSFDYSFISSLKARYKIMSTKYSDSIKIICRSAPLLGLLGTVTGMVITFEMLSSDFGIIDQEHMSEGISQALISTQMGLLVAIPGLVLGRVLDRKMEHFQDYIETVSDKIGAL